MVSGRPISGLSEGVGGELATAYMMLSLGEQVRPPLGAWEELVAAIDVGAPAKVVSIERSRRGRPLRVAVAVAAAFAMLIAVSLRAGPDSPLYRIRRDSEQLALVFAPHDASLRLRLAGARLDDLLVALSNGDYDRAPGLADALQAQRAAAISDGANVQLLDARMTATLTPALAKAPASLARTVTDCLNDAVPDDGQDGPGDPNNPDARSDATAGIKPGESAPSTAPVPPREPAPMPSYTASSEERD